MVLPFVPLNKKLQSKFSKTSTRCPIIYIYITVLHNLQEDCKTAIQWFGDNGMKANPKKFQFMILSPIQHEVTHLKLCDDVSINSESSVKVLGVIIDNRLALTEHISRCCKKAARQLNALSRIIWT